MSTREFGIVVGMIFCMGSASAQSMDRRWFGGYDSNFDPPYGGNKTGYPSGGGIWSTAEDRPMNLSNTVAVLTDLEDSVIAYTNGIYVANRNGLPMLNGTGLNPSSFTSNDQVWGLPLPNSHVFVPFPGSDSLVAMFHVTIDTSDASSILIATRLYESIIDLSLDAGNGGLLSKNEVLLSGEFCRSGIAVVKHGNGRDWWIFFHENNSNIIIQYLLTPSGLDGPWFQSTGAVRHGYSPVAMVSKDGEHFLIMDAGAGLDVFDLDRCSGILSNPRHADINDGMLNGQAEFSPSGRFVYVTSVVKIYQYDLNAPDLAGSQTVVAVWDSTYDTYSYLTTLFINLALAPDGKIYVSTGNTTHFMHIIDQPDSLGLACNVIQHGHNRQTFTDNSIPYRPNYYLGQLPGSVCDTLGLGVTEHSPPLSIAAYPNPSNGAFTLSYPAQSSVGTLEVRDLSGRIVLHERIPQWSTVHKVPLMNAAAGLYQCVIRWPDAKAAVRVVVE